MVGEHLSRVPGRQPDHLYSYSFAQKHDWPEHYSTQGALLAYFQSCADELGLRPFIRFAEVRSAVYDDARAVWTLEVCTSDGTTEWLEANAVISAVGQLNRPLIPDIAGLDTFAGPFHHGPLGPRRRPAGTAGR